MAKTIEELKVLLGYIESDAVLNLGITIEDIPNLEKLSQGNDLVAAMRAVESLCKLNDEKAFDAIQKAIGRDIPVLKIAVAVGSKSLPKLNFDKVIPSLLEDIDLGVRKVTLKMLPQEISLSLKNQIKKIAISDSSITVRDIALKILGKAKNSTIGIDCRGLVHEWLVMINANTGEGQIATNPPADKGDSKEWFYCHNRIVNFYLEDGLYTIVLQSGNVSIINFTVKEGIIDYAAELDSVIAGKGTNTLILIGVPITIDATKVTDPLVYMPGVYGLDGFDVTNASRPLQTGNFLPNCHDIDDGWPYYFIIAGGVVATFQFKIQLNGLVTYKSEFDDSVTGKGTNLLKILKFTPVR